MALLQRDLAESLEELGRERFIEPLRFALAQVAQGAHRFAGEGDAVERPVRMLFLEPFRVEYRRVLGLGGLVGRERGQGYDRSTARFDSGFHV